MPTLSLEEFANPPKIGDKITVTGKVESINEESNEVEVSYDTIKVNNKKSSEMKKEKDSDSDDEEETETSTETIETVDEAMAREFPNRPVY